ncbi:putative MFS multidrug resistance transporter [Plectosphaerella plurivora]|uniref:MFS multidrug resistance transporter n=1 Tax=Plectosphaerella plurivora TaxID=936078 RepID=A0A9P8V8M5_9PEZI|nr:putative MFS multidrug resistance transporter [Plectosphaerella plurivora]
MESSSRSSPTVTVRSDDERPEAPSAEPAVSAPPARSVVQRCQRRGLLAGLCIIPETEIGTNKTRREKWAITAIVALCGAVGPFGSAIILPVLGSIAESYETTPTVSSLSLSIYMLAMAIFPLWWSSSSEMFGRRSIYIISNAGLMVFGMLSAVSPTISMFLVMRFLTGGVASAALSVGAGTIADIWEPKERGTAMTYYLLGPLCGPLIAPLVGGGLSQGLGWRSTLWFLGIYGYKSMSDEFIMVMLVIFTLPETSAPLARRSQTIPESATFQVPGEERMQKWSGKVITARLSSYMAMMKAIFIDPLRLLAYLRFPPVALTVYVQSVSFGALYFLNISLEYTFSAEPYKFETWAIGFVFAPASLGFLVAGLVGGPWMDRIMHRHALKKKRYGADGKLVYLPEDRIRENVWLGLVLYPVMMIWYGWAAQYHLMWAIVLAPCLLLGLASFLLISVSTTMLTEFMPGRSASGVAINNLCRNTIAFAASLATITWLESIGNGWGMTVVSIWLLSLAVVVLLMYKYGTRWRKEMNQHLKGA